MKEIDKLEVMRLVDIELDPCPKCGDYLVPCRCKLKKVWDAASNAITHWDDVTARDANLTFAMADLKQAIKDTENV